MRKKVCKDFSLGFQLYEVTEQISGSYPRGGETLLELWRPPPQLVLGPCDFSRILENSRLVLRSAGLRNDVTFQKTCYILLGWSFFLLMKYLETQKKAPGITGDTTGVGALMGMLCSHCCWSYRNSC